MTPQHFTREILNFPFRFRNRFFCFAISSSTNDHLSSPAITMDDGLEMIMFFMAAAAEEEEDELSLEERRRCSRKFPRLSIRKCSQSPFECMFLKGRDQALTNCCGINHKVFHELLNHFQPVFNQHTINRDTGLINGLTSNRGRPREIDAISIL